MEGCESSGWGWQASRGCRCVSSHLTVWKWHGLSSPLVLCFPACLLSASTTGQETFPVATNRSLLRFRFCISFFLFNLCSLFPSLRIFLNSPLNSHWWCFQSNNCYFFFTWYHYKWHLFYRPEYLAQSLPRVETNCGCMAEFSLHHPTVACASIMVITLPSLLVPSVTLYMYAFWILSAFPYHHIHTLEAVQIHSLRPSRSREQKSSVFSAALRHQVGAARSATVSLMRSCKHKAAWWGGMGGWWRRMRPEGQMKLTPFIQPKEKAIISEYTASP